MTTSEPLFAIHIVRGYDGKTPFELLQTVQRRSSLEDAKLQALELLKTYPDLMSGDQVLVRNVQDGREVYRWPERHAVE